MARKIKNEDMRLNIVVNGDPARKEISELLQDTNRLRNANEKLEASQRKLRKEGKEDSREYRELTAKIKDNEATIRQNSTRVKELTSQLNINSMTTAELKRKINELSSVLSRLDPGSKEWKKCNDELRQAKSRLSELNGMSKQTRGAFGQMTSGVSMFVGKIMLAYAAVRAFFGIFSGGIKKIKEFEQANVNLSTILGVSTKEMEPLTKSALELGRTTEYTASQVTNLETELAKLGFGQQAILQMQKPILQFATAVGAELPEAAALAGATLRAFDKDASDTSEVLATMAVGTNKSALSFAYLRESMSIVAPVAKTFGFGIKDVVTLLGTLANSGFDASSAATATRNILLNLADANGKLAKELGKPVHTLPELIAGLKQLDEKGVNLAKTLELTDKRSVAAFNTFLHGTETMNDLRGALENVDGELERIQTERLNTVEGSVKLLESAWEGLVLSFYNSKGAMKTVVDGLTAIVEAMTNLIDPSARVERHINDMADQMIEEYKLGGDQGYEAYYTAGKTVRQKHEYNRKQLDPIAEFLYDKFGIRNNAYRKWERSDPGLPEFDQAKVIADQRIAQIKVEERTRKEREAEEKSRREAQQRQEAAAAAYAALTEKEMAERIAIKKKYLNGEIGTEEEYNEQLLQLNIDAMQRRLKSSQLKGKERLTAEEQLTTLLLQQKKEERAKLDQIEKQRIESIADPIEKENAIYAQQQEKYAGNDAMLEQLARNHARRITEIKFKQITDELAILEKGYKEDRALLVKQQAEELAIANLTNQQRKRLKQQQIEDLKALDAEYYTSMLTMIQTLSSMGQIDIPTAEGLVKSIDLDSALLSDEEKQKLQVMIDSFTKKLEEAKRRVGELGYSFSNKQGDILGFSQEDWQTFFKNLGDGQIGAEGLKMGLMAAAEAAEMAMNLYSSYDKMMTAKENAELKKYKKNQDAKKKQLQSRLDAGLITQEQHDQQVEQMDAEYDRKQEELQLKQAKRQKAMNLMQATIATARAVAEALPNLVLAAIAGAMGAAQIAMIAATPIAGAEKGGFPVERMQDGRKFNAQVKPDARGYVNRPTVIVGENGTEYIIPNEAMQNPTAAPIINAFEAVRRRGRLRDYDFTQIIPAPARAIGYAAGGPTGSMPAIYGSAETPASDSAALIQVLGRLSALLEKPIKADVSLMGRGGLLEKQQEYERMKNRGKIG